MQPQPHNPLIREVAYARAGLIGNPSDGYGGRTISLTVCNFRAQVTMYEWDEIELIWSQEDKSRFRNLAELVGDVERNGYYGGIRLVKATVKKFHDYCTRLGIRLPDRKFTIRYESDIPRQVGLAGSSAIVVATLRCLRRFYADAAVNVPIHLAPSLALAVETEELRLHAGLQDRVIQVYQGLVFMDFTTQQTDSATQLRHGEYHRLTPRWPIPLYIAYRAEAGKAHQNVHDKLREGVERGEEKSLAAIRRWIALTDQARQVIESPSPDVKTLGELMNANFDQRAEVCHIPPAHAEMVHLARRLGASAKFAGSGGAIIGTYEDDATYARLRAELEGRGYKVIQPIIFPSENATGVREPLSPDAGDW